MEPVLKSTSRGRESIHKAIVVVDMVGYSSIARSLQEHTSVDTVVELNRQIQELIDSALVTVQADRKRSVMTTTGDGAIVLFDSCDQAHSFAEAVHRLADGRNRTKTDEHARHWFRIGVATGPLSRGRAPEGRYEYAGIAIANAVRLEAASQPGEVLIDVPTYEALPQDLRLLYQVEESVAGKRDERFLARRYRVVAGAPILKPLHRSIPTMRGSAERREIVSLMNSILEEGDLDKLVFLIEMPLDRQPARSLPLDQRRSQILLWASSLRGCGTERLKDELRFVLELAGAET